MTRTFCGLGAVSAFIGVIAGAFGAHVLQGRMSLQMQGVFETGARYQMYHALALIGTAWLQDRRPSSAFVVGGWCFAVGTVLFSGSLYLLSMSGIGWLGAVTPFGGVAFLAGWACIAWGAWKA